MKIQAKQNEYKTDSLSLSAFLLCHSHMVKRVENSSQVAGKYNFVFEQSPTLIDLIGKFESYSEKVSPQNYYLAVREVKRMLSEYRKMK